MMIQCWVGRPCAVQEPLLRVFGVCSEWEVGNGVLAILPFLFI